MKIAILARNHDLYSHKRLKEAGESKGHEVVLLDTLSCYINIAASKPAIHYKKGQKITEIDAIIPRIGASITFYGTAVVRQFETMGVYTLNSSLSITKSRDKLRSLQYLSQKGIDMPITGFAHSLANTKNLIEMVGGVPLVIKILEGTQGKGVMLVESYQGAENVIDAFRGLKANILVQEFIKEADGADIRCLVVGDKVVASIKRQAKDGDFRSNLHCGGRSSQVKITKEERAIAVKASKILGLNVAGVDILRSNRGPMVIEVNSSPGLRGVEEATGKDVAGHIIEFMEKHMKNKFNKV